MDNIFLICWSSLKKNLKLRNKDFEEIHIQDNNQNLLLLARFIFEQKPLLKSNHYYSKFTILGLFSLEPRLVGPRFNSRSDSVLNQDGTLLQWQGGLG